MAKIGIVTSGDYSLQCGQISGQVLAHNPVTSTAKDTVVGR
jgi:hypothetical protein